MASTFFVVLYVALSVPIIGVGLAGAAVGLVPSAVTFAVVVAALAAIAFVSLLRRSSSSAG